MILLAGEGWAAASADIEVVRPQFTEAGLPGVDALGWRRGSFHAGALLQFQHNPLVLYGNGETKAAVIASRSTLTLGATYAPNRRVAVRMSLPLVFDWGTEAPTLAAQGLAAGDLWTGLVVDAVEAGPLQLGAHADLALPVGAPAAWRGEGSLRFAPGILAGLHFGRLALATDVGLLLRPQVDTGLDLTLGNEAVGDLGIRWTVWERHLDVGGVLLLRTGIRPDAGPGERVGEALLDTRITASRALQLDLFVGRGLTEGYGSTDFRAGLGATWRILPPPRAVAAATPPAPPAPIPPDPPDPPADLPVVVTLSPVALARVEADEIVLRDQIQFAVGTDRILPASAPTLTGIAKLLQEHPEIAELVIEGHASEEGSFSFNYDLSLRRASAIFKALVLEGVHPERLSCRAMGEVVPVGSGTDEAERARDRRVLFRIARRVAPGDPLPTYVNDILLPWNGEPATIPAPPPVAVPAPAPDPEEEEP